MSGRIISIVLGMGQRFPGIGPTVWSQAASLGTDKALVVVSLSTLVYHNEFTMRLSVSWKSTLPPSWTERF